MNFNERNKFARNEICIRFTINKLDEMKRSKMLLSLLFLFAGFLSCHRKDDLPETIIGYVKEFNSSRMVPFAYVTVGIEKHPDIFTSTFEVTDTLRADINGRFELDRSKYMDIDNNCGCTFVACGQGPDDPSGADYYDDHCYQTTFDPTNQRDIICLTKTMGFVRIYVNDIAPANTDYQAVMFSVTDPAGTNGNQAYPNPEYNTLLGYTMGPYPSDIELHIELSVIDEQGLGHSEIHSLDTVPIGLDTTDIYFQY